MADIMVKARHLVLGIDYGTDSVRALVADAADGRVFGQGAAAYRRWAAGKYCEPRENRFRQHPLDHVEGLETAVGAALRAAESGLPGAAARVRALAVDTTGSTPCLADAAGRPLALDPAFSEEPDAMFILWKDHTSVAEAERINTLARGWGGDDYTKYEGGIYSSEWFWAKALRVVERNPRVASAAATIIEHSDWMPALLTGVDDCRRVRRNRCAMGHKAMWHASWGGYPSVDFLARLHPRLAELGASLGSETWTVAEGAGALCPEWAGRLGLPAGIPVAVGALDAHVGAVGGAVSPGTLLKIMGTSTCDIMVGPRAEGQERLIAGICGQVDGSVIPGYLGYEAGQSAYGDLFAWFRDLLAWPLRVAPSPTDGAAIEPQHEDQLSRIVDGILPALQEAAARLEPGAGGVTALDWHNGRRTPDADQSLRGAIAGLSLGTGAPEIYRALLEAAAFGSRAIVERMRSEGLAIDRVAAIGGVARKSPLAMQVLADVLGMPIEVTSSDESCALGAAMVAAALAGLHPDLLAAQTAMKAPPERLHEPDPARRAAYDELWLRYQALGAFAAGEAGRRA